MTRSTFDRQLSEIEEDMLVLAGMVDRAIDRSITSLKARDVELARRGTGLGSGGRTAGGRRRAQGSDSLGLRVRRGGLHGEAAGSDDAQTFDRDVDSAVEREARAIVARRERLVLHDSYVDLTRCGTVRGRASPGSSAVGDSYRARPPRSAGRRGTAPGR